MTDYNKSSERYQHIIPVDDLISNMSTQVWLNRNGCAEQNYKFHATALDMDNKPEIINGWVVFCKLLEDVCPRHTTDPQAACPMGISLPDLRARIVSGKT